MARRRASTKTGSLRWLIRSHCWPTTPSSSSRWREEARFEAPKLVDDADADLSVRAWRFSYNARGIIEMPNSLCAADTALIMVHPWGIDDGQGWKTPEPNGVCDFCTPVKNGLAARHTREVVNPFLKSLRGKVSFVMFSIPGPGDASRKKAYRTFRHIPTPRGTGGRHERDQGETRRSVV